MMSTNDNDSTENNIYKPKEVENTIADVMKLIASKGLGTIDLSSAPDDELDIESLNFQFDKLLRNIKTNTQLTEVERTLFSTEATLTLNNYKEQQIKALKALPRYDSSFPKSTLYSNTASPYVCCYSNGPVGQAIYNQFKKLGNAVNVKYLDCNTLLGIPEQELRFIIKGAKTIILACDTPTPTNTKKGWFEIDTTPTTTLNANGLKRVLNIAVTERNKVSDPYPVKIVTLVKGNKESKSIASLIGGDTFDLENECILLCNQRNLNYAIVKTGQVVDDSSNIVTEGNTYKRLKDEISDKTVSNKYPSNAQHIVDSILSRPFLLTTSRIDVSEVTWVSVAVEGLLRLASYPILNTTLGLVSTPSTSSSTSSTSPSTSPSTSSTITSGSSASGNSANIAVTQEDWDDELVKLLGPELLRIPLKYATPSQAIAKLTKAALKIAEPGSGLITPIVVEKYSNAIRIIFKPKESTYTSAKEDRIAMSANDSVSSTSTSSTSSTTLPNTPKAPTGYLSPEQEAKLLKKDTEAKALETKNKVIQQQQKLKLEGGLEVIIDDVPYKRVRIRRCNMGPQTVVKEESEGALIKMFRSAIQVLEQDYRILLSTNYTAN